MNDSTTFQHASTEWLPSGPTVTTVVKSFRVAGVKHSRCYVIVADPEGRDLAIDPQGRVHDLDGPSVPAAVNAVVDFCINEVW